MVILMPEYLMYTAVYWNTLIHITGSIFLSSIPLCIFWLEVSKPAAILEIYIIHKWNHEATFQYYAAFIILQKMFSDQLKKKKLHYFVQNKDYQNV